MFPLHNTPAATKPARNDPSKPLIRFRFVALCQSMILHRNKTRGGFMAKDFAGEVFITR
jgi:hypothetical protein